MKRLTLLCVLGFVALIIANTASVAAPSNEKGPRCSDGIDNDGDTFIDGDDPDCGGDGDGGSGGGGTEGNPSFVYSTIGDGGVMRVMDADGSNNRRLSQIAATYAIIGPTPHWGPDGNEVAWVDWKFNRWSGIVVVRLDGGPHPVGDPCGGETSCLLFEDSGDFEATGPLDWGVPSCEIANSIAGDRFIAFRGRGYIHDPDQVDEDFFLINRENPATSIDDLINVTNTQDEGLGALTWSDDSQRIAVYATSVANPWGESGNIAIIDVCNGFSRTEITLPDESHPIQRVHFMDWGMQQGLDYILVTSSGGVWIVPVVTDPNTTPDPIQIVTSDNQFNDPFHAVWSPDGTEIAVAYGESDGSAAIAILDVTNVFNPLLVRTISATKRAGRIDWRLEDSR
ncbi:exported protein of unknown function [uncultured Woeseiaceae bacterium]|uniref:Uncharacterized protein n=1 Tax=uncultured Woeseiaceae bacterium TaxID=1983305 RepID=A0A7D9D259_9GAMM|nr:exported protein of unknown function [uncultured Woeseiaceae bacterium]